MPGGIIDVDHPAMAMPALCGQVVASVAGGVACEWNTFANQPVDTFPAPFDDKTGDFFVAQAGAGD